MHIFKQFKKMDLKPLQILKIAGLIVLGLVILALAFQLIGSSFRTFSNAISGNLQITKHHNAIDDGGYASESAAYAMDYEESMAPTSYGSSPLPDRAILPPRPGGGTVGSDAEEYEVTEYSVRIETRNLTNICDTVASLKEREDIIFENANEYDHGCNYTFKVENASAGEVLAILEELDPRELSENTYTIKQQITNLTNEEEVLLRKRESIEETLESALDAYEDITTLATRTQNAEALAQIIDSRVRIIERLTQERIAIDERLDRLARAKEDQLDRLEYTFFNVHVSENTFIDLEQLQDSWKAAIKDFVRDVNKIVQGITINLILLLLLLVQWALYALILLVIAKYGWQLVKYIWTK